MTRQEMALDIADYGQREEYHQRKTRDPQSQSDSHWTMYDYYKGKRLLLEREYRRLYQ
jgi:hypothetical protein